MHISVGFQHFCVGKVALILLAGRGFSQVTVQLPLSRLGLGPARRLEREALRSLNTIALGDWMNSLRLVQHPAATKRAIDGPGPFVEARAIRWINPFRMPVLDDTAANRTRYIRRIGNNGSRQLWLRPELYREAKAIPIASPSTVFRLPPIYSRLFS